MSYSDDELFAKSVREVFAHFQQMFKEAEKRGLSMCLIPTELAQRHPLMKAPDPLTAMQLSNLKVHISKSL